VKHESQGQPIDDQLILCYVKAIRKNKFQKPLKIHIVADGLNFIDDNISNFKNIFQGEDIEYSGCSNRNFRLGVVRILILSLSIMPL
jgi:hypothetical protein